MTLYRTPEESRDAGVAYHLTPQPVWEAQRASGTYRPEAFEQDGFVHATNGLDTLLWVANEFYTSDTRPYMVLVLDVRKLASPVRYDDDNEVFPHIYGPLNADAVIAELGVERDSEGRFTGFVAS